MSKTSIIDKNSTGSINQKNELTALTVENLSVYFKDSNNQKEYALKDISINLQKGRILGIVGESGSGKSVLTQSILNLADPGIIDSGSVNFEGQNILDLGYDDLRKIRGGDISIIFADPTTCFDPLFPVGTQMVDTIRAHDSSISPEDAKNKAIELLKMVGLPSPEKRINDYPFQFSGGMIQRVLIATAISTDPEVIIADNPTQALDVTIQAQILRLLKKMQEEVNTAFLFISHNLGVVSQVAQDVAVLYKGLIVEIGSKQDVLYNSKHPYTKSLVESIPKLLGERTDRLKTIKQIRETGVPEGCVFYNFCTYATEECKKAPPSLKVSETHNVSCWNWEKV